VGERRLAAIMFTDIVGYTALAQRNESLALALLEEQRSLVRSIIPKHGGKEIKTIGDAFLLIFSSALEATTCAIEIQEEIERRNSSEPDDERVSLRIGIHVGDILEQRDDVAGDGVNVASRIDRFCEPGAICITQQVYDQVRNKLGKPLVSMGLQELKNVQEPMELYKVITKAGATTSGQFKFDKARVAVLPMSSTSPEGKDDYFADGMTEELIFTLSKIQAIRVIARTSVMKYKGVQKSAADIGKELGVGVLLEGSVRKADHKIRINVQLIDTHSQEPLWSEMYDRELLDVFSIQEDIANRVAEALKVEMTHGQGVVSRDSTRSADAYTAYLRGRYFWNKRTAESLKKAIDYFNDSLALDPQFARSYAGIADSYAALALLEFMPPREAFPRAKEAAQKAISIDGTLAEAHTSLGLVKYQYEWDWRGAEMEFNKALQLNQSYPPAHHFYADYLKAMGRFEEALEEIRKAQELDPLSLAINTGVGHVLYLSRKYDEAIEQYRRTVELDPNFLPTHLWFGRPYLQKGMFKEALDELQIAVSLSGNSTIALAMLGHALASAGQKERAEAILEELHKRSSTQYVPSYWIATIYNGFGDADNVFEWYGKAYDERSSWLVWINVEPRLDWLRADSRFISLLKKIGFP
jgi:adenylate cyclase